MTAASNEHPARCDAAGSELENGAATIRLARAPTATATHRTTSAGPLHNPKHRARSEPRPLHPSMAQRAFGMSNGYRGNTVPALLLRLHRMYKRAPSRRLVVASWQRARKSAAEPGIDGVPASMRANPKAGRRTAKIRRSLPFQVEPVPGRSWWNQVSNPIQTDQRAFGSGLLCPIMTRYHPFIGVWIVCAWSGVEQRKPAWNGLQRET